MQSIMLKFVYENVMVNSLKGFASDRNNRIYNRIQIIERRKKPNKIYTTLFVLYTIQTFCKTKTASFSFM